MTKVIQQSARDLSVTVRVLRRERGWSQEALAQRMRDLGQTSWRQTTVAKVEAATRPRPVTLQEAIALAASLGVARITDLLGQDNSVSHHLVSNFHDRNKQSLDRAVDLTIARMREIDPTEADRLARVLSPRVVQLMKKARALAYDDVAHHGEGARGLLEHLHDLDPDLAEALASGRHGDLDG